MKHCMFLLSENNRCDNVSFIDILQVSHVYLLHQIVNSVLNRQEGQG